MRVRLRDTIALLLSTCDYCPQVSAWPTSPHRTSLPSSGPCRPWPRPRTPANRLRIRNNQYRRATSSEVDGASPELDNPMKLNGLRPSSARTTGGGDSLPTVSQEREYWLDLRGLSVSPAEAFKFLDSLLEDSDGLRNGMDDLVDRVLVDQSESTDDKETTDGIATLIFNKEVNHGNPSIFNDARRQTLSGSVISAEPTRNLDALLAMDVVVTNGEWVLIDTDPAYLAESTEWMSKQVSDLYELLVTSYNGLSDSHGGLILPASPVGRAPLGGIAISVPTSTALLGVDFALTQAALTRRAGPGRANDGAVLRPIDAGASDLHTALVVPFDLDMWRLLMDLKGS